MKRTYCMLLLVITSVVYGQGEANNWYFGQNAGLNFGTTPPTPLTNGRLNTLEGCTTISDATGNLLFYTDGSTIYTRNHQVMLNGQGLKGDFSSTTSALIIPQPNTPNVYIVFTVDEPHHFNADNDSETIDGDGVNDGFMYSVVDMRLDNGNGAVIEGQKNIPLITYNTSDPQESAYKCSEKITAVKSDTCDSFWVITHFIDTYYSFSVDQTGVNTNPVLSKVGTSVPITGYRRNALGYLKTSPEGDKLAVAHLGYATTTGAEAPGGVLLYDFDNSTGQVSNEVVLYSGDSPYGIEFSQNGQRLYTTISIIEESSITSFMVQFDLSLASDQISASGTRIKNENGNEISGFSAGALQLGPDGKIYRALYDFANREGNHVGVIENPEDIASAITYRERGIRVNTDGGRGSRIGLPPFIQSIFARSIDIINNGEINDINLTLCEGESYRLSYQDIPGATYTWFTEDIPITNSTPFLDISTSGNYRLELDLNDGSCPLVGAANVTFFEIPTIAATPSNQNICDPDNDESILIDLTSYDLEIIGAQDPDQFQVRYFSSEDEANTDTNQLPQEFSTQNNPQTIVARIENRGNKNCYAITSFQIEIFETPTAVDEIPLVFCDNDEDGDDTNSSLTFDLTSLSSQIYNGQDTVTFDVSYHSTETGAETNTDLIIDPTSAVLSNEVSVYARIENSLNTDCFNVLEIPIIINPLPNITINSLTQCDAFGDTNDTITIFDLTQVSEFIRNSNDTIDITFYEDFDNAFAEIDPIPSPEAYQNTPNQQLFIRADNPETNCYRIETLDLIVNTTTATNVVLQQCDEDDIEDGFWEFDLRSADDLILQGITGTGFSVSYHLSKDDALLEDNPLTTYTNNTSFTQGEDIIFARIEDANNGCFGISEVILFLNPLPPIAPQDEYFLCANDVVTIDSGILESGENPADFDYLWSNGATTENITVTESGNYEVTVANANTGCVKNRSIQVIGSSIATIQEIEINDARANNSVTVVVSGSGNYEYALEIEGNLGLYQDSPIFMEVPPGFHRVYVQDKNGCGNIISDTFAVIGFPKYFTPNGDSFHETWNVEGISDELSTETRIYIFDRYGKLLKQLVPDGNGWDGVYNGQLMPSSEYWFRIDLGDGRTVSGSFSLIR